MNKRTTRKPGATPDAAHLPDSAAAPLIPSDVLTQACACCGAILPAPLLMLDAIPGQEHLRRAVMVALTDNHPITFLGSGGALADALAFGRISRHYGVTAYLTTPCICGNAGDSYLACRCSPEVLVAWQRRPALPGRIALSLSLRRREILGLRPADINLKRRELRVTGALQRIRGKLVRTTPKTKTSIRTLPLSETLALVLRDHLKRQEATFPHAEYVFVSSHGTPIDPRNLLRRFKRALERAKLPATICFHDLRHSCATFLIAQGEHPRVVMEIFGHAQMSTTMDIYGHVLPSTQRAAASKLDEVLGEAADNDQQSGHEGGDQPTENEGE